MFPTDSLDALVREHGRRLRAEAAAERLRASFAVRDCPLVAFARRVAALFHTSPLAHRPASQL